MIARVLLALLLAASFGAVTAPVPAAASDDCAACPAAGGAEEDCGDDCPLCACGPHRAPMTETPAVPNPLLSPVAQFHGSGDPSAIAPAPRDILHVPRPSAVSQHS